MEWEELSAKCVLCLRIYVIMLSSSLSLQSQYSYWRRRFVDIKKRSVCYHHHYNRISWLATENTGNFIYFCWFSIQRILLVGFLFNFFLSPSLEYFMVSIELPHVFVFNIIKRGLWFFRFGRVQHFTQLDFEFLVICVTIVWCISLYKIHFQIGFVFLTKRGQSKSKQA